MTTSATARSSASACSATGTRSSFASLNAVERAVPAGKVIHVILDNYAAHKHAKVRCWLTRHPRWIFHFTPTSCSWLNAVESLFAKLAKRQLKRGVFPSVVALQQAINGFVAAHNREPKPFVWQADPKPSSPPPNEGTKR
jgi:transposase